VYATSDRHLESRRGASGGSVNAGSPPVVVDGDVDGCPAPSIFSAATPVVGMECATGRSALASAETPPRHPFHPRRRRFGFHGSRTNPARQRTGVGITAGSIP